MTMYAAKIQLFGFTSATSQVSVDEFHRELNIVVTITAMMLMMILSV